jgi:hypothetical protein
MSKIRIKSRNENLRHGAERKAEAVRHYGFDDADHRHLES